MVEHQATDLEVRGSSFSLEIKPLELYPLITASWSVCQFGLYRFFRR